MRARLFGWIALALLLAGSACGRGSAPDAPAGRTQPLAAGPTEGFPSPASLLDGARSASYVESDLVRLAVDWSASLPPNRTDPSQGFLLLQPAVLPGQLNSISRYSYALYSFTLADYDLDAVLGLDYLVLPPDPQQVFVGLGNFESDNWDWFAAPQQGAQLSLGSFAPYIEPVSDRLLLLVVAGGTGQLGLQRLRVGRHYDEFEDSSNGYNKLPDASFSGFSASLGAGQGYPGYDGDDNDRYLLFGYSGDRLHVTVEYDNGTADLQLDLSDLSSGPISSTQGPSPLELIRTFTADEPGPYALNVELLNGYSDYTLAAVREFAPRARISADEWRGAAPLDVQFNAGASFDPDGTIVKYEWDWDGDGVYDEDGGATPTAQHAYAVEGGYNAAVRLTDDDGRTAVARLTVTVGDLPYDEIEQNDMVGAFSFLPQSQFSGYSCSIGAGQGYPGYDGDDTDGYYFYLPPGNSRTFSIDYDPADNPGMSAFIADSGIFGGVNATPAGPGRLTVCATSGPLSRQPFFLHVSTSAGSFGDYALSSSAGRAPGALLTASPVAALAPLDVSFNAGDTTDDGTIVKYEWDWDGDLVFDQNTGGVPNAMHNFGVAGNYPVHMRATDNDGLVSTATLTIYAWPSAYDETEPNDYFNYQRVYLPALPFDGYRGSIGSGPGHPGYNGDAADLFAVTGDFGIGDKLVFTMESDALTGDAGLMLQDAASNLIYGISDDDDGSETVSRTINGTETLPMVVRVYTPLNGGYSNYTLSGAIE